MKKIEMLWSVTLYPQKYHTMRFQRRYMEDDRLHFQFSNGAIAFVPLWPSEFYRGAILPYIEVRGIERTLYNQHWEKKAPEKTYAVILPSNDGTVQMIYNETHELATLTEFSPEHPTPWRP